MSDEKDGKTQEIQEVAPTNRIELPIFKNTLERHAESVAQAIFNEFGRKKFVYAGVGMGGLPWAGLVLGYLEKLNPRYMEKSVIFAKAYKGTVREENTTVKIAGSRHIWEKSTVVLIDDIIDTGLTARACAAALVENMGVKKVCMGAMIKKDLPEKMRVPFVWDAFCGFMASRDTPYLVGFGLDYCEKYRTLEFIDELERVQRKEKEESDGSGMGSGEEGRGSADSPARGRDGDGGPKSWLDLKAGGVRRFADSALARLRGRDKSPPSA